MRIVVTRPAAQAGELVARLEALGHRVAVCPLIEIEPLGDGPLDTTPYDWVVVTSPNGAREFARRRAGTIRRLAAVGPGTADALREAGLPPTLVASPSTQEGLAAALPRPPGRVLLAAAEGARDHLVRAVGAEFVSLYRTRELAPDAFPDGDLVVLASASAARAFGRLGVTVPVVSIGPQTTQAARAAGATVLAEALTHDGDGLVRAVAGIVL